LLAAFQRARTLFPFPILGIDTDNGGEFLNEEVVAYCEQKNGAVVRQVVGYDRFVGEHACRQLTELYRALRLYVNCFQPSMKLQSKLREGKKVRCVYDPAKTPLQRLLLSGVLPVQKQQELIEVAQALDPIRLFQRKIFGEAMRGVARKFQHILFSMCSTNVAIKCPHHGYQDVSHAESSLVVI